MYFFIHTSDSVNPPTLTVKPRRTHRLYEDKPSNFVIRGKQSAGALQFISKHSFLQQKQYNIIWNKENRHSSFVTPDKITREKGKRRKTIHIFVSRY